VSERAPNGCSTDLSRAEVKSPTAIRSITSGYRALSKRDPQSSNDPLLSATDRPRPITCLSDHGLVIVLIGINPSAMAAATGDRFPEPSNRF
jgi:hypothetical protein